MGNGGTQSLPFWTYDDNGNRIDNITDWALKQFKDHYKTVVTPAKAGVQSVSVTTEAKALGSGLRRNDEQEAKALGSGPRRNDEQEAKALGPGLRRDDEQEAKALDPGLRRNDEQEAKALDSGPRRNDEQEAKALGSGLRRDDEQEAKVLDSGLRRDDEKKQGAGKGKAAPITKEAIFHYVYAVLHDPVYREKYAQNLKREFPRIPFHADFWRWADWGKTLMDLHIGYETVEPWPLKRTDIPDEKARKNGASPKALLKADKDHGRIVLDSETTLSGVPPEAWDYKLGNRSALEWILDQYKEKKPKDPTIRERFNTYRFADYKDRVIDLLARVTRVSVETQAIVEAMRGTAR